MQSNTETSDLKTLIQQVQLGQSDAYEIVVQRFRDMAVGYSYARLGDLDLAEDVAQEAFINAYYHLPDLRHTRKYFVKVRSWVSMPRWTRMGAACLPVVGAA